MSVVKQAPNTFNRLVLHSNRRLVMPISTYPGLALVKARVRDVVTNPQAQVDVQTALHERYDTSFVMSAMDLSAEAEAFGCELQMSDGEVPTVAGRLVTGLEQAQRLSIPTVGDSRTWVFVETVRRLRAVSSSVFVLAGSIGPFSLAARLTGVSEAMELTVTEPDLMHVLLEKSTAFLTAYARAFRSAGADGLIMAEPAAGLLSPRGMVIFSSRYVKRIACAFAAEDFSIILHNCAARLVHLPAVLETGLRSFHFGSPMDLPGALGKVASDVVLCGNLDPAKIFCQLPPEEVEANTISLLRATARHKNFVISSGCDLPPSARLSSLDAFYSGVRLAGQSEG